jgi:RNA polymerase sigma factor (sigma-70 family)
LRSDDEVLVNRCLEGDQPAFAFLVDKYKEVVHAYAYRRVGDYQEAEDIAQEVFIKAYRKLAQLKWPHKFRSWLYTIVSNECKMWLRRHSKEREQEVSWEDVPVEELDELAVRAHSDEDIKLTVKSAMETLPDDRELALSLYYMSSLSVKEIAHFMGVSPNSVRIKLHRARKQLGERVEKMIGKQLRKEKLRSGFVFKVVNSIKDMPIPSLPKPRPIRWAPIPISIGAALLIGVIGFGISSGRDVSQDMPVLKPLEMPCEVSLLPDLDSYPEQAEAVKVANENSSLKEGKGFSIRKVWADPDADNCRAVSPDGRYLSYGDYWDNGDLAIYEIATGKKRRLTDQANSGYSEPMECAFYPRWSPDGKHIVYAWYREDDLVKTSDLRIIGLDGSKPRILYSNEKLVWAQTYDWSPDGKQILACVTEKDGPNQIVLVSAADGSVRVLKTLVGDYYPENMWFSPDGRYIVYDFPQKEDSPEHDISLLSTDGSREISLVRHPADDYVLGWAPDGKNILFASDRTVTLGAWLIAVDDGKPQGTPELVKPDIRRQFIPLGFTRDGSFYYGCGQGNKAEKFSQAFKDVYIAKLDPETGKILIPPRKAITRFEGFNIAPNYSPDGKYLAYISTRGDLGLTPNHRPRALCIRSLETGEERELLPKLKRTDFPRWSPDCRSFLVMGRDDRDRRGIFQIDAQTGDVITPIVLSDEYKDVGSYEWSRDGKAVFYTLNNETNNICQIILRDLETGIEEVIYHAPGKETLNFGISLSPDGNWLASINFNIFGYYSVTRRGKRALKIMPAAGGEPRELYIFVDNWNNRPIPITWTADGKYILFLREKPEKDDPKWELCRISADGGEPERLGLEMTRFEFNSLSVHPDGQHIAFSTSTTRPAEIWVMENLLPEFTAAR